MAANPIERKMWADLTAIGGPDVLLERIADGVTMGVLAAELGVSRGFFSSRINKLPGMKDRLAEARLGRAEKYADEALEIADSVPEESNAINKAKIRIDARKWLAGVDNPEKYGQKPAQVNVSIGGLHLDALRRVQSDLAKAISAPDVIDAEAEDVTDR
jgi:hypothetical protein